MRAPVQSYRSWASRPSVRAARLAGAAPDAPALAAAGGAPPAVAAAAGAHAHRISQYWSGAVWVAAVFIALLCVRLHELYPPLRIIKPMVLASLIGGGLLWSRTPPEVFVAATRDPRLRLIGLYALWSAITVPTALLPGKSFNSLIVFAFALLLGVALLVVRPDGVNLHRLTTAFVGSIATSATMLLLLGVSVGGGRLSTLGAYDPNDLAALMSMAFPFAMALVLERGGARRMLGLVTAALIVLVVMKTGSRGGTLGLGVGALVFMLGQRPGRSALLLIALLVGSAVAWRFAPPMFQERINSLFALEEDYNTTSRSGRQETWKRGITYIRQSPVLGTGMNNFQEAEGQRNRELGLKGKWMAPHNTYVQVFAELGIPGGLILLTILGTGIRDGWRTWRLRRDQSGRTLPHRPQFLAAILAYCFSAFFLSHAYFYPLFAIVLLARFSERVRQTEVTSQQLGMGAPGAGWPTPAAARR